MDDITWILLTKVFANMMHMATQIVNHFINFETYHTPQKGTHT